MPANEKKRAKSSKVYADIVSMCKMQFDISAEYKTLLFFGSKQIM